MATFILTVVKTLNFTSSSPARLLILFSVRKQICVFISTICVQLKYSRSLISNLAFVFVILFRAIQWHNLPKFHLWADFNTSWVMRYFWIFPPFIEGAYSWICVGLCQMWGKGKEQKRTLFPVCPEPKIFCTANHCLTILTLLTSDKPHHTMNDRHPPSWKRHLKRKWQIWWPKLNKLGRDDIKRTNY